MKKLMEKYGKKKVYITSILILALIIGVCTGGTVVYANNKKQAILDSIYINFKQAPIIEYGTEIVDYQSFIENFVGEVTLPTEMIDTKEIGSKELIYKVSKDGYEKEQKLTVEIKDTQFPTITLKEETITIEVGSEFDPKSNIESVQDLVDGAIEEYEVTHNIDVNVPGEYTVTIKATDKNGNVTEKTYTVVVKEKEVAQSVSPQSNSGISYNGGYTSKPNTPSYSGGSNSSSSNNNSSSNNGLKYFPNLIGNSGKIFSSWEEADAWADKELDKYLLEGKYFAYMVYNIGVPGYEDDFWTVDFE